MLDIDGCIQISMCLIVADLTAKRLLIRSVGSIYIMTDAAFLGGVGALDSRCSYPPLGRIPGDLFWDVCEIRSTHIGIHGSGLVLHRCNREVFIGDLRALMLGKALVDRAIDLLTDVAGKTFPALAAGRREFLDTLLLQALTELGLAPPFLSVTFLPLS